MNLPSFTNITLPGYYYLILNARPRPILSLVHQNKLTLKITKKKKKKCMRFGIYFNRNNHLINRNVYGRVCFD